MTQNYACLALLFLGAHRVLTVQVEERVQTVRLLFFPQKVQVVVYVIKRKSAQTLERILEVLGAVFCFSVKVVVFGCVEVNDVKLFFLFHYININFLNKINTCGRIFCSRFVVRTPAKFLARRFCWQ